VIGNDYAAANAAPSLPIRAVADDKDALAGCNYRIRGAIDRADRGRDRDRRLRFFWKVPQKNKKSKKNRLFLE
jgi:hypothetical protein